jgi:DNA-binding MarR family transcriptional regulator
MQHTLPMHHCNAFAVRRAARIVTQFYERHMSLAGVTSAQFSIVSALRHEPGMTTSALAEALGMERTTLVRALKPLQRDGLVVFTAQATQSRSLSLALSAKGGRKYDQALPHWLAAQREFEARVGKERAKTLREEWLDIGELG